MIIAIYYTKRRKDDGLKKRLLLAVVDPVRFYVLTEELKSHGVSYGVPATAPFLCSKDEVALCDERGIRMISGECERIQVSEPGKRLIMELFPRLYGKAEFKEISVGIDLGSFAAFVVSGDGELLLTGKIPTQRLGRALKDIALIPHEKMIVRLGSWNSSDAVWKIAGEILMDLDAAVEIVDEFGTTKNSLEDERDPDIRAAKSILKKGRLA